MLTEVKNQLKVSLLSIKYCLIREMLNKTTFITNIVFMILNNSAMIIQWIVIYSLKDSIAGYSFKEILLLWALAASTYGVSRFFFYNSFNLSEVINIGKLDAYLVQPKNVLISVITSSIKTSAIGDILFGYIFLFVYGFSIKLFLLFTFFSITGGLILTGIAVILGSLSFYINKADLIADNGNNLMIYFGTYPDGIFKGIVKILFFSLVPIGLANYIPVSIMINFNIINSLIVIGFTTFIILLAFFIFNLGLRRYSSSNLMSARV